MKILINIIKKIEANLSSLEVLMNQEHKNLLNPDSNMNELKFIIKKKEHFLKQFLELSKERAFFEKKNNIFLPYKEHHELKKYSILIFKKSCLLKKINIQNKILLNKKFYFNQYFLELFLSDRKCITYNLSGNLEY
ncbi:flagellar export chaperone FlgN [Buchnera aphidicola]|nr:flagellar export chaperone FlgN [Buchnera aphidicola]WAI03263.1 MAG: flagellar biosynthesis protein FlgN [Buchnera aphidicola (Myzus persicae)]